MKVNGGKILDNKERILLDVDTGIDDALAILLALKSKNIIVEGITTGYGAVSVDKATDNTLRVIELAKVDYNVPVAMGADHPLFRKWNGPVSHIHGHNGIGDYQLPDSSSKPLEENATDFIIKKINDNVNELTLVCTARLTNLAAALEKDPSIASKVKCLVLMGGAVRVSGNVTPFSEANIYDDPEAAHRVFESGIPITMVGLDVTMKTVFHDKDLHKLKQVSTQDNESIIFVEHILNYYSDAYLRENNFVGCPLHDPLAVAVVIDPSLVKTEDIYVKIETENKKHLGETKEDIEKSSKFNTSVCIDVDESRFIESFINIIAH